MLKFQWNWTKPELIRILLVISLDLVDSHTTQARQCEESIIYSIWAFVTFKLKKAYFWIISALEASNWSHITFCFLTNVLNSISERFGSIFEQTNIPRTVTAITVACILIYYLDKDLPMACNRQSSSWAQDSILTLTQLDSTVAYSSIGSKLQKVNWGFLCKVWVHSLKYINSFYGSLSVVLHGHIFG